MRIDLTVDGSAGPRDVAISAPSAVAFETVSDALLSAAGASLTSRVWSGEVALAGAQRLGEPGLRTGALLSLDAPVRRGAHPGVLSLQIVGGPGAGRIVGLERGRLTIGRGDACDVVLRDDRASRFHAAIEVGATAIWLRDLGSTNGTRVDDHEVGPEGCRVQPGQVISVGDCRLVVCGPGNVPAALTPTEAGVLVNRAPRQLAPAPDTVISLPPRPDAERPRPLQWVTVLLPALAGGAIAWLTRSPQFLLFALLSPVMAVSGFLGDRRHWRRSRRRNAAAYRQRRAETDAVVLRGLAAETAARRAALPDPAQAWRTATTPGTRLWERRRSDDDHLVLRVGCGDLPATLLVGDAGRMRPAGVLHAVPLCVDLRVGPVGVVGPAHPATALARWLVAQLAVLHSPADVDLVLLLSAERAVEWSWARWLPHLGTRVATHRDEWQHLLASITANVRGQRHTRNPTAGGQWSGRWIVLVIDTTSGLSDLPGLDTLLDDGAARGVTAVCVDAEAQTLPASCTQIASSSGDTGTGVTLWRGAAAVDAVADLVSLEWAEQVARALAPLVDASSEVSALPETCALLDVLGMPDLDADVVAACWARSNGRPDTALGLSIEGPVRVDLVTDGPHALVAGTTGAGKSELLQSLVTGLAVLHPPDELTFLLVDYKGGAAFSSCVQLPHAAGLVTDLDPHLTRRALRSLDAELRRRERLFAEAGVPDLDAYRRASARTPVPRLVIVVDEFASLAEELPEFVRGVVAVAQRGRSLGIHLVLATQRPGSVVTPEVRANTSLRIALRVTDPGESSDVVDAPDAAWIDRSRPGRAYLRTGANLTSFQTARTAGPSVRAGAAVEPLLPWRRIAGRSSAADGAGALARTVEVILAAAGMAGTTPADRPWLEPLPANVLLADLTPSTPTAIAIGRVDLPEEQAQPLLELDLATGSSVLVAGRPGSGRTTTLLTTALAAAARWSPNDLDIHVLDPSGALADALGPLPHIGTCLGPDAVTLSATLLRRLRAGAARGRATGGTCRHTLVLLLVDSWDSLLAAAEDTEAAGCADELAALLRSGAGCGLTVVVAGGRTVLAPRIAASFGTRLLLDLHDRNDYASAGLAARTVPTPLPPGRGVRVSDGAEFQVAIPGADSNPALAERIAARWPQTRARAGAVRVRPLPQRVRLRDLPAVPDRMRLGVAGESAQPVWVDVLAGAGRILVAGPPRSGRTTLLRTVLMEAPRLGLTVVVAAPSRSPLAVSAAELGARVIAPASQSIGGPPAANSIVLVDDSEAFVDTAAGDQMCGWLRTETPPAVIVAGRCDDLATTYRGIAAEVRRVHCGVLLRPGPADGEILGVRLPRRPAAGPPGRGVVIGDPCWGPPFESGEPLPIQVALP